jgi:Tumour suppressor protein
MYFVFFTEPGRGPAQADILGRLDPTPLNTLLQRYEDYLRNAASRTAADQGRLSRRMRDVEAETAALASSLHERQRRYERACEKLAGVRDISRTLAKCHMLLNEVRN